ncbi:hypothetical protein K6V78_08855 [Streptococcus gallolyticus]|nr:hypothetical protein [Streptococcus gallolyticus]MBY5041616.1 hypothetical protein [Streptococcus gallolyticus]
MPKFRTTLWDNLPEEKLATIGAGVDAYRMIGMWGMEVLTSGLLLFLTSSQITGFYLVLIALAYSYLFVYKDRSMLY